LNIFYLQNKFVKERAIKFDLTNPLSEQV
jgi:hypothetical protein